MHRKNCQFASLKENSASSSWDFTKSCLQGDGTPRPETVVRRCQHCGVGENSTPAMHRGPAEPRTLCNACGQTRDGYNDFNTFYMQVSIVTLDVICWIL
ncbi:GATA transcription factor 24-like [Camellia sinensis]|uniref:GATA transcription factor 24-like n=1 Tax=Camellia sinensis TaxID=4442 RepID=UPI0010360894|nr:GATA transcription factor 24-like [Camellia sinensis]